MPRLRGTILQILHRMSLHEAIRGDRTNFHEHRPDEDVIVTVTAPSVERAERTYEAVRKALEPLGLE